MKGSLLKSSNRNTLGKNSSKKSRREGFIPAVLYSKGSNYHLELDSSETVDILRKNGENALIHLNVNDETITTIIKEVQRHPISGQIYHIDLMPVKSDSVVSIKVPIAYKNTNNIKRNGGTIQSQKDHIEVLGNANDIPKNITVDASKYDVNQTIRIKDIEISKELSINENIENVIASFTKNTI